MRLESHVLCDYSRMRLLSLRKDKHTEAARMKKGKRVSERLGGREREIVDAVFALGNRASAEEIRARLTNPPGESSVRVMLARLEKKGFLKHEQDGQRYMYSATVSPTVAKRTALQRYLKTFFGGSLKQMVTALMTESSWTDEELEALTDEIARVRNERKK